MKNLNTLEIIFIIGLVGFVLLGFSQQYFFLTREYNEYSFISKDQFNNTNFTNVSIVLIAQILASFLIYIITSNKK